MGRLESVCQTSLQCIPSRGCDVGEFARHHGCVITASCLAVKNCSIWTTPGRCTAGMVNVLQPFAWRQIPDLPEPSLAGRCGDVWCRDRQRGCGLRRALPRYTLWPSACTALGPAPQRSSLRCTPRSKQRQPPAASCPRPSSPICRWRPIRPEGVDREPPANRLVHPPLREQRPGDTFAGRCR